MIIKSVHVSNFRSVLNETLYCDQLTALVGANGTGKSTFLRALDLFYNLSPKIDVEDFHDGNISQEISIAVTFKDLSREAKGLFAKYLQGDELTVERVFSWDKGKVETKYHGAALQNTDFQRVRDGLSVKDRGKTAKEAYDLIRSQEEYSSLPPWTSLSAVSESLKQWEEQNPVSCIQQRDDGQFFGFKAVGQGYLGRFTRFLFIPAVRNASDDASEAKGSVLTSLMDLVVRSVLATKEAVVRLKEETQRQYEEIMDPSKLTELSTLAEKVTTTLQTFVPDAEIDLRWLPLEEVSIPMPKADVKLIEDGYSSTVTRTGHGLQRAFILTMLQHLALAQTSVDVNSEGEETGSVLPSFVLAVEEPELYQHPNRQRHFANILLQLSKGKTPGVAERTQVIYGTHSPLFVGIDRIEQIRLLRKISNADDKPKITKIVSTTLNEVAELIWRADGEPVTRYTGESLLLRLQAIMTPWMNEGFFADVVVAVEGEDDRAAILGFSKAMGIDLESKGFAIIPCGGKNNLDRPIAIFSQLGIPVYAIWDGDEGERDANPSDNHRLLRLMKEEVEDWPCLIKDNFACFKQDLETTLCEEIGSKTFDELLSECQKEFCIPKRKHAIKNPFVISSIINYSKKLGYTSRSLVQIIDKIVALKN